MIQNMHNNQRIYYLFKFIYFTFVCVFVRVCTCGIYLNILHVKYISKLIPITFNMIRYPPLNRHLPLRIRTPPPLRLSTMLETVQLYRESLETDPWKRIFCSLYSTTRQMLSPPKYRHRRTTVHRTYKPIFLGDIKQSL